MIGVTWSKTNRRWRASHSGYPNHYIGEFLTEAGAQAARLAAEFEIDGYAHSSAVAYLDGDVAMVPVFAKRGQLAAWTIVAAEDYEIAARFRWNMTESGYAISRIDGEYRYLHRLVMPGPGFADHIDGDRLNNRRSNLRLCDRNGNARNRRNQAKNNTTGYKGVKRHGDKFAASIWVNSKWIWLGSHDTPQQAAAAYDAAAIAMHGEFASPNSLTRSRRELPKVPA